MADTPKHSVSVAGIVVDDQDRVLVIQRRDNGYWEPPGGVLELDEGPEEGTRREVLEETGIEVKVLHLSGVYKNFSLGVIALVFRCKAITGSATPSSEAVSVEWKRLDKIVEQMSPAYSMRVCDAFDSAVSVRTHDGHSVFD